MLLGVLAAVARPHFHAKVAPALVEAFRSSAVPPESTGVSVSWFAPAVRMAVEYRITMPPFDSANTLCTLAVEIWYEAPMLPQLPESLQVMSLTPFDAKVSEIAVFSAPDRVRPSDTFARMV